MSNVSISLGTGSDVLTFGNYTNTATVSNGSSVLGGSGADNVTLGSALTDSTVGRSGRRAPTR